MRTPEIVNAQIVDTMLGIEDHGILTCSIGLKWGGCVHCGFGGYGFDQYDATAKKRVGHPYGSWFIRRVLEAVGVDRWEHLKGKYVRAEVDGTVLRIGHITDDVWFDPKNEWKEPR